MKYPARTPQPKQANLITMLVMLTCLFIFAQATFFFIHYKVSDLVDSLVNSSIYSALLYPAILFPILLFIIMQFIAYALFVSWIWLLAIACGDVFKLSARVIYGLGIINWIIACALMFSLNSYFYPHSFFAVSYFKSPLWIGIPLVWLTLLTLLVGINVVKYHRHRTLSILLFAVITSTFITAGYNRLMLLPSTHRNNTSQPNVILIGLDSVRPDFISYFGHSKVKTPTIDAFLNSATTFTHAYTPLARTYPAWISILTAKYPVHTGARNNLVDTTAILSNGTLAERMQQAGYQTIYATDEKRFSNITTAYGFDRVIGPAMGVNDFLLGGLADFPMSNLLINSVIGKYLFPYNYANRAAAITYQPVSFTNLLASALARRSTKPTFIAIHLCLSHWPFSWSQDQQVQHDYLPAQYANSVAGVDLQLKAVLHLLKLNGLLQHSIVVLLSDHGTTVGLPNDRLLTKNNYRGDPQKMKLIPVERLSSARPNSIDFKNDYTINTAYGQGTDLLSLKQYQILLAFKNFGMPSHVGARNENVSLLDIAPTILEMLQLSPLKKIDGISLQSQLTSNKTLPENKRPLFMETGDSMTEIQTDHIYIEKVIKREIGIYKINPANGLLYMDPVAEGALIKNKQLGVLSGDWILVRYPARVQHILTAADKNFPTNLIFKPIIIPSYYLLANIRTGAWTIGINNNLGKLANAPQLAQFLKIFYSNEL